MATITVKNFLQIAKVQTRFLRSYSSINAFCKHLDNELESIRLAGTFKNERIITTKQGPLIKVLNNSNEILNFCANNYLGLSSHPEVIEAAKQALDKYGAGLSSVRFICGTQNIHKELEAKISEFHGREDCILYASCFDANAGVFETLLGPEDAVISDELNHASIIDGIRLCKAQRLRYKHKDMNGMIEFKLFPDTPGSKLPAFVILTTILSEDLEEKLKESSKARFRLIVTDGVFSMDGNVAPLKYICDLSDKYNSMVFVDECHATGFFGKTGRGTEEYLNIGKNRVHIINSTLGKALGGALGGYTVGPKQVIGLLRQRSRPYLFSNTLPPAVVAGAYKSIELVMKDPSLSGKVAENTTKFRTEMTALGFKIAGENHPICPVMLGDAKLASQFADMMLSEC